MLKKLICKISVFLLIILVTLPSCSALAEDNPYKITQKDMIYFIMTDRFYDGDMSNDADVNKNDPSAFHGGDFQGIIDKLDYIKNLGFTAIWITPVVQNQAGGYHGYWATDFYKTDSHLGSIDKLKELVQKAHSKGIKVIVDLVVNHTGDKDPWVNDPALKDWFHKHINISNYNDQNEVENGWLAGLPDLNQDNPQVSKYLIDMANWWIRETGIDGYRLDTMKHVPKTFWQKFISSIKKDNPDFYTIGEVYDGNIKYVSGYQNTGVSGLLDYPLYFAINDVFKNGSPEFKLEDIINRSSSYKNRNLMGTFIDNHDVERFSNNIDKFKDEKLKQALTFMMTYTGIPIMYYGTEIAMEGGADPDNRRDMDWNTKSPITDYVKKLTSLRKSNNVLTEGDIKVFGDDTDLLCYSRNLGGNSIVAVYNMLDDEKNALINIPGEGKNNGTAAELLSGGSIRIKSGTINIKMAPHDVYVFMIKKNASKTGSLNITMIAVSSAVVLCISSAVVYFVRRNKANRR